MGPSRAFSLASRATARSTPSPPPQTPQAAVVREPMRRRCWVDTNGGILEIRSTAETKPGRQSAENPLAFQRGAASLLRHPGLAQAGKKSRFEQGVVLRHPEKSLPQACDARIRALALQPAGLGQFGGSPRGLAV